MKKKIFLTLAIVMVLTCLFAIGVSAEEMNPEYNADYVKTMTSNMTTVELEDGTSVPLYDAQGYTLAYYWDDISSATKKLLSVRTKDLTFNFNGTKLSSIYYGDEHLAGTANAGRLVVINLRGVKNNSGADITDFNTDNMFKENSLLQHIFMPDSIEHLISYAFGHRSNTVASLRGCYFSENSKLQEIKSNTFMNATQLRGFYIPKGVTYIGSNGFQGCHNAFFVNNSYDFLTKPEVYYFPDGLFKAEGEAFDSLKYNLNNVLVFSADNITIENAYAFEVVSTNGSGGKPTIVFTGDVASVNVGSWNVEKIYFANKNDVDTTTAGVTGSKSMVFCNAADNTTHLYKVAVNTAPTCTKPGVNGTACFCGKPNPDSPSIPAQHDYNKTLSYNAWAWENDNYFANAHYVHVCQVCAEEYPGAEIANSHLFIKEGYSYTQTENKKDETVVSFDFQYSIKVNQTAMTLYTEQTGNVVKYGTVAGVKDDLSNPLTYVDGVLTVGESAAASDMTGTDYVKLLIKVAGIPVNENGIEISCNAYAIIDNKLKYLSDGNVRDSAFVSTIK